MGKIHRGKKPIDLPLLREVNNLHEVGDKKGLQAYHGREIYLLCYSIGLDDRIQGLLAIFTIKLNPPRIPLGKAV
jgi:hypothetical protein